MMFEEWLNKQILPNLTRKEMLKSKGISLEDAKWIFDAALYSMMDKLDGLTRET